MVRKKEIRTRGKIPLSKYFQKFKEGENVAVKRDISLKVNFPKRLQGKTGIVEEKRGKAYVVKIKDIAKEKQFLIEPIHLKKIKTTPKLK